jgi:hypothetical protein
VRTQNPPSSSKARDHAEVVGVASLIADSLVVDHGHGFGVIRARPLLVSRCVTVLARFGAHERGPLLDDRRTIEDESGVHQRIHESDGKRGQTTTCHRRTSRPAAGAGKRQSRRSGRTTATRRSVADEERARSTLTMPF